MINPSFEPHKATLELLQQAGLIKSFIPEDVSEDLEMFRELNGYESIWELIINDYREYLTEAGVRMEKEMEPTRLLGEVPERAIGEELATKRQIGFLKHWEVKDETKLSMLGTHQATTAIIHILEENRIAELHELKLFNGHQFDGVFAFTTRKSSSESQYALWTTTFRELTPLIQGPINKTKALMWLATHLRDKDTKIVQIAKDGLLLDRIQCLRMISEAAALVAEWVLKNEA